MWSDVTEKHLMNVCGSSRVQNKRTSQWSLKMRESQEAIEIERGVMGLHRSEVMGVCVCVCRRGYR